LHLLVYADQLFVILYKELYYRHVYARVQVICVALVLEINVACVDVFSSCSRSDTSSANSLPSGMLMTVVFGPSAVLVYDWEVSLVDIAQRPSSLLPKS